NVIIAENQAQTDGNDVQHVNGTLNAYRTLSSYEFANVDVNCLYDPNAPLFVDVDAGDYRLAPNSQAIDKGDKEYAYEVGMTVDSRDLAGEPRFIGDSVDIGAYEARSVKLSQSGSYAGNVLVEWAPVPEAVSVRVAWSTATASYLLGVFDANGDFTWDTAQHADGPGSLQVEFLDAVGAALEVVDVYGVILNAGNIYVDTASLALDDFDGKTSLLEAVQYVEKYRIAAPIKFAPELAGKTIVVNAPLSLTSASFDGGETGVVLDVASLTIARPKRNQTTVALQNVAVKTGNLVVDGWLNLADSSVEFVAKDGVAPTFGGSGQATVENVAFVGDASTWTVGDSFVFRKATFDADVLLSGGSTLNLQTQATINSTVTVGDAKAQTIVRIDGDATLSGVGVLQFGGSDKSVLQINGSDAEKAVLTVANSLTLQGFGKIDGANFTVVCDGTFEPQGAFALNGDFTLGPEGRLVFGVASLKDYATLTVSGDATLWGTVELVKLRFDFVPTTMNSFKFLKTKTLEIDEGVWYEGTFFGDYAELTPEITGDTLLFTVGYVSGPKVVAVVPSDATSSGSSAPYLDVYFDQSIDVSTFTVDDVAIVDANGNAITFEAPRSLNRGNNVFRIYFNANDYRDGTYSITIGPDVRNPLGTTMNQDGSPPNGGEEDAFVGSFVFAAPNLQVAFDVDAFSESGFLGQKLAVTIATENVGVANALGSWRNQIYLSKDQTLSSNDYLLTTYVDGADSRLTTALEAGERKLRVVQCALPLDNRTWVEGDYYLIVVNDVYSDVYESNNNDNQAVSGKISLVYPELADLKVVSVAAPQEATAGETVEIVWTTENDGDRAATETWRESIYISPTGSLADATLLKTLTVYDDLSSGDSIQRRTNVVVPAQGFVGSACFIVVCDSYDAVLEENDDNNSIVSAPATVLRQKLTLSASTQVSESEQLRVVLSRTGDVSQEATATLTVGDASELDVPSEVVFARGQSSVAFYVSAIADREFDDDQWTTLTATLDGYDVASQDFCVVNVDKAALTLSLSAGIGCEGDELTLTVSRNYVVDSPLTVKLTASPSKQLNLPTSVTIPASESSATATVYVVDNDVPESETNVQIRATSLNFIADSETLTVVDDDEPTISLTFVESTVQEGIGANAAIGVVSRAEAASSPLRVRLTSSRTDKLLVPQEVTIPAGKTSVEFSVASLDNGVVDGEVEVTISASGVLENCDCSSPTDSTGYAIATLISLDDDGPKLTLTLDKAIFAEGGKDATLTVKRNTETTEPLTVSLTSSDETEIALPTTIVIPTGQSSVSISVSALEDSEVDEDQWVTLEAAADGFTRGTALALVTDASSSDLRVVSLSTPSSSVEMGSTVEVAYRVENQGTIPAAVENGAWVEKVWLSRSSSITSSSTLVATFERSEALSYESDANAYERKFSVDIPSAVGSYYIIVQLDTENAVYESIESNNSFVSDAITSVYTPKYSAVVQTDVEKADPATPIPMYGYAYKLETGERAPNVEVEVFVVTKYGTRSFCVTTDETGAFETTWTPLATESGAYTIGAAHPWYSSAPAQDKFSLMKMSAGFTRGSFSIVENATASGSFPIYNESSEPITGLNYEIEGLAENIALDVKFSSSTIPAGGSVTVTLTAKALNASIPTSSAIFRFTSAETNPISGSLTFDVYREDPYLTCDVQKISGSMTRGEQKFVELTICNESGVESGPVELALPDVDWMLPVGGATLPSLAPGEVRTVKLLLNPSEDMELTIYRGSFGINYANTGIKIDYQYRLRADSTGELRVLAVDEYYYHSEDQPTLSGASVKLVDTVTKQVVSTGTTADDGALTIRQLPEGYYDVYISADGHNNYSKTVYVEAGENELEALLTKQTVRYEWTVTPTTIEDEYEITIETVYEVNVPAPVVTIDPPQMDLSDLLEVGQRKQINFTLTNHGLIAAHDVAPFFEDHPELKFTPLVEILDELPAKSSYVIPVIIERVAAASGSSAVAAEEATGDAASNVGETVEKY
ncbi:MAG: hypothetical protein IKK39_01035, partial [Thermoguttaceae bacterium]|nr:hypothetical protein [Thermoguttaceae bacterium]